MNTSWHQGGQIIEGGEINFLKCFAVFKLCPMLYSCAAVFHHRKDVKEKWDHKKSLKQNLQSLNLVYSPDEMLHGTATEPVAMVRLMSSIP